MNTQDYIWLQFIKFIAPLVWKFLPKDSQRDILQELWAWQETLRFRKKGYLEQVEMDELIQKLKSK